MTARVLNNGVGLILGYIFDGGTAVECGATPRLAVVSESDAFNISSSGGRYLTSDYWGNYVAVLPGANPNRINVIKDPTGNLPAFATYFEGVTVLFSHMEDCIALQLRRFTVNPAYIRRFAFSQGEDVNHDALNEIVAIRRGECVTVDTQGPPYIFSRQFYWHPQRFPRSSEMLEDAPGAVRSIRTVTLATTHSLASLHTRIITRLSGGLDSSIVTGCLAGAPGAPQLLCHTYFASGSVGDERPWAREVARHSGARHVEWAVDPNIKLESARALLYSAQPLLTFPFLQLEPTERRLGAQFGATAVFTGHGGDAVFGNNAAPFCLDAYIRRYGLTPGALGLAARVGRYRDLLAWTVLTQSARRLLTRATFGDYDRAYGIHSELLTREAVQEHTHLRHHPHPWFCMEDPIPWTTALTLGELMISPERFGSFSPVREPSLDRHMPLLSQPAIELFLRIPAYLHLQDGRNRSLARVAFKEEVPERVLKRTWKDRGPRYLEAVVHRNIEYLRETLLDGLLVKERVLNRNALLSALSESGDKTKFYSNSLLFFADIEAWISKWPNQGTCGTAT